MQEYFSEIEDPRHEGYVKHKLADVLTIVMCAVMCRMTELCEIMYSQKVGQNFWQQILE